MIISFVTIPILHVFVLSYHNFSTIRKSSQVLKMQNSKSFYSTARLHALCMCCDSLLNIKPKHFPLVQYKSFLSYVMITLQIFANKRFVYLYISFDIKIPFRIILIDPPLLSLSKKSWELLSLKRVVLYFLWSIAMT